MRRNGFKLEEWKPRLDVRKKRAVKHWKWLPGEVVNDPSLEGFKVMLDGILGRLV